MRHSGNHRSRRDSSSGAGSHHSRGQHSASFSTNTGHIGTGFPSPTGMLSSSGVMFSGPSHHFADGRGGSIHHSMLPVPGTLPTPTPVLIDARPTQWVNPSLLPTLFHPGAPAASLADHHHHHHPSLHPELVGTTPAFAHHLGSMGPPSMMGLTSPLLMRAHHFGGIPPSRLPTVIEDRRDIRRGRSRQRDANVTSSIGPIGSGIGQGIDGLGHSSMSLSERRSHSRSRSRGTRRSSSSMVDHRIAPAMTAHVPHVHPQRQRFLMHGTRIDSSSNRSNNNSSLMTARSSDTGHRGRLHHSSVATNNHHHQNYHRPISSMNSMNNAPNLLSSASSSSSSSAKSSSMVSSSSMTRHQRNHVGSKQHSLKRSLRRGALTKAAIESLRFQESLKDSLSESRFLGREQFETTSDGQPIVAPTVNDTVVIPGSMFANASPSSSSSSSILLNHHTNFPSSISSSLYSHSSSSMMSEGCSSSYSSSYEKKKKVDYGMPKLRFGPWMERARRATISARIANELNEDDVFLGDGMEDVMTAMINSSLVDDLRNTSGTLNTAQNNYNQYFIDCRRRPYNFIREMKRLERLSEYPKLRRLMQLKMKAVEHARTPAMYKQCDLKCYDLSQMETKFDVILVDPPWSIYKDRCPGAWSNINREVWTFEEMCRLRINDIAETPSFLFLWCCNGDGLNKGRTLLKKWGYKRCEVITWLKTNQRSVVRRRCKSCAKRYYRDHWAEIAGDVGREGVKEEEEWDDDGDLGSLLGPRKRKSEEDVKDGSPYHYWCEDCDVNADEFDTFGMTDSICASSIEHCLMGIRGQVKRSVDFHFIHANVDTDVIISENSPYGSTRKPFELYELIEKFCLGKKRIELFGESHNIRNGWVTLGKELPVFGPFDMTLYNEWIHGEKGVRYVQNNSDIDILRPKSPPREGLGAGSGGGSSGTSSAQNKSGNHLQSKQGGKGTMHHAMKHIQNITNHS